MKRAFTLVELLVVVAIIVVLLALLMPGLQKAIYQAELTVCGANYKGIGNGTATYAVDHKRFYPHRALENYWTPNWIANPGVGDDRSVFRTYLHLNSAFNDPFLPKLDFESADAATQQIGSDPYFWFSWRLTVSEKAMRKLGDRFTNIEANWGRTPGRQHSFNVLASDQDAMRVPGDVTCNHPAPTGKNWWVKTTPTAEWGTTAVVQYWTTNTWQREPVDLNYCFDDLSVIRFDQVLPQDDRMAQVQCVAGNPPPYPSVHFNLPNARSP